MTGDGMTELRERQDKLDERMTTLEGTVKEQATLRAAMDSDLSKLKAHEDSMQALHLTQADHTRRLTRIEDRVGNVEDRLGHVEDRLGHVEEGLETVKVGVHAILDLLDTHLARKPRWGSLISMLKHAGQRDRADSGS